MFFQTQHEALAWAYVSPPDLRVRRVLPPALRVAFNKGLRLLLKIPTWCVTSQLFVQHGAITNVISEEHCQKFKKSTPVLIRNFDVAQKVQDSHIIYYFNMFFCTKKLKKHQELAKCHITSAYVVFVHLLSL